MFSLKNTWKLVPVLDPPQWFVEAVQQHTEKSVRYLAALLWQRGIHNAEKLPGFLNPQLYPSTSPFEFGQEMCIAVNRLQQAREKGEKVAIWGDFDADGVTATAVLWEGLGQFFQASQLTYYIPNRLTESHGLNHTGIDLLVQSGIQLIVTCDTGSTNGEEIEYAQQQGIETIVTDHHTLPNHRPPVVAIVNPRYLGENHPLYHLSGVAVAYKLVEAFYQTLPEVPQQPLENLLDLVAIGLIADLVELSGDCRYLAQEGIQKLQQQLTHPTRPGVARLLELCKRSGDRPTDISFGLGPRINAVSRIQGDAAFCVELLTSRDRQRCHQLAMATELANTRRQELQRDVTRQVKEKLARLDLSTTCAIVLDDPQWAVGVLGLVAGQIAQEYGRPTILLSTDGENGEQDEENGSIPIARGSARSINGVDLYQLVKSQGHLLDRFGGHPFAAGLSLPVDNIPLFVEGINRQLRQKIAAGETTLGQVVEADLVVTVPELGKGLFRELKFIEPCGMGNPVPKLLLQNCWFEQLWHQNIKDSKGRKIKYIKTEFEIWDELAKEGFPGVCWGHYKDEIPTGRCHAIVELDYNTYKHRYEVRLIDWRPALENLNLGLESKNTRKILDWRSMNEEEKPTESVEVPVLENCPTSWDQLQEWLRNSPNSDQLAIAYPLANPVPPEQLWQQLVGIAKYLSRTDKAIAIQQISQKLDLSDRTIQLGLNALKISGFKVKALDSKLSFKLDINSGILQDKLVFNLKNKDELERFLEAVKEEQFRRYYFSRVPISTIQSMANLIRSNQS